MNPISGLVCLIFISCSSSTPTTNTTNFFYYPSPKEDGTMMKAYLTADFCPDHPVEEIHFYLYTKDNNDTPQEIIVDDLDSVENSNFNKDWPVKFISHGFGGEYTDGCLTRIRNAYLQLPNELNVILVDWKILAEDPIYVCAANSTKKVGERTGELIDWLIDNDYARLSDIHVIGYSLGAHVAGNTGHAVKHGKIARITALDPALPVFEVTTDEFRIDPTDAEFVDVLHTGMGTLIEGGLAFVQPRGHVDYYPNRGASQPGCVPEFFSSCSHGRACQYMAESILATSSEQEFTACRCSAWESFEQEDCVCKVKVAMGEFVDKTTLSGKYYLHTNDKAPFARGDDMAPPTRF